MLDNILYFTSKMDGIRFRSYIK